MRTSQLYAPTLREVPAEAEIVSHQYMLRAGLMRKSTTGVYTYLPLGLRVLQKIMDIIRDELNRAGGQEILLPIMQPAELWHQTGRWEDYGQEMFKLTDRHSRSFCLGPTHEEIITTLVKDEVRSYRQLPLRLYQIQNKYRDEIRPRFGVMRSREFIMKDLYSFDCDQAGLSASYEAMYAAYERIFRRCGAQARPVEADSGAIGGDTTHEFMVLADSGEASIVYCSDCEYAANVERAECASGQYTSAAASELLPLEEIQTPGVKTVEQLSSFIDTDPKQCIKTMIYIADGRPVAALIRGDHTLNEVKLHNVLDCTTLELADPETIARVTNAPVGFAGPVGLSSIDVVADHAIAHITNGVTGANKEDAHLINVNMERDFLPKAFFDLRNAEEGDPCPRCSGTLKTTRGIEVGQVFELGTKYSDALDASYLDENGKKHPLMMGCYGIGVSRTMAAVIEQNHDEDGICWPTSIAPYQIIVVPVNYKDTAQRAAAEDLYDSLSAEGFEVVLDDRFERAGVKFKDADLIGYPVRITIGPKSLKEGQVEITARKDKSQYQVAIDQAAEKVRTLLSH